MKQYLYIINGPNLNLLGKREPSIYGEGSFEDYFQALRKDYPTVELILFQSNWEGALIDIIQQKGFEQDTLGFILNAGALTHTSIALHDTLRSIPVPVVEVHISNTFAREPFRHHSYLSPVAKGVIVGFGYDSYRLAIESFLITKL